MMIATDAHDRCAQTTLVACLCAAWCRTCDAYHEVIAALRQQYPDFRFVWVDIEDDEELVGDLEVETFPTLLIGVGEQLRFIGPVTPHLATAQRLLASAAEMPAAAASPAAQALLVRLQSSC
ncbi:thioredoxin family protein [Roseateles albus]|uniref:Thioredoxin family protein n=1 Tax=Roseateles albus TaxID=2987525 RepID=A0ABT5K837_9BURK|nr:thioredoxin family protein [Roseateles albus]MDC8770124.1 thioredoxin family protein [Roseateles albus]